MAIKKYWLGSVGPFLFDDTEDAPGGGGEKQVAFRTDGRVIHGDAVEEGDSITKGQVDKVDVNNKSIIWFLS